MGRTSNERTLEDRTFVAVLIGITAVFILSVWPFVGAILWSLVAGIMFAPLNARLVAALAGRRNMAALLTLLIIAAVIVFPAILLSATLLDQAGSIYGRIQSGEIDIGRTFDRGQAMLPEWLRGILHRTGVTSLGSLRETLSAGIATQFRSLASQAFSIGQGAASFLLSLAVMFYLTFFLLRDGEALSSRIGSAIPLAADERSILAERFVTVVRATVKGGLIVGIAQGALGGLVMWLLGVPNALLWAVMMAISSLLPAVGTGLVWVPVSIYLLSTGAVWQGIVMALSGLLLIGSVDNILRPILIGRDTKIPDALVLVTTLGGIATFGFNGLLIGPVAAALFLTIWNRLSIARHKRDSEQSVV
ncbi:AI-2E family transporter [Sphingomonas oryzagri]